MIRKNGVKRQIVDIKRRFSLLQFAKKIIQSKKVKIEFRDGKIKYWGLISKINNKIIKVVLRKKGEGKLHFYSIFDQTKTSQ